MKKLFLTLLTGFLFLATSTISYAEGKYVKYEDGFNVEQGTIVVDIGARKLYYVLDEQSAVEFPIAIGRPGMETGIIGFWHVSRKKEWPTWTPTEAMRERNPAKYEPLAGGVEGGPDNPLGSRALYLGNSTYRIHGTNEPDSIGKAVSSGCIRLLNEDVELIYEYTELGQRVVVVQSLDQLHPSEEQNIDGLY